jgi:hypothetical protein
MSIASIRFRSGISCKSAINRTQSVHCTTCEESLHFAGSLTTFFTNIGDGFLKVGNFLKSAEQTPGRYARRAIYEPEPHCESQHA